MAGIVLAAGLSRRAGRVDKLTAHLSGSPLFLHPVRAGVEAGLAPLVVVTGGPGTGAHDALQPLDREEGAGVVTVVNPDPARGLASSLRIGVTALPAGTPGVVVLLGDMPWVRPGTLRSLVRAFLEDPTAACVPVHEGRRGNPVLWPSRYFDALAGLEGDRGARTLLEDPGIPVRPVAVADPGIHRDVDTEEEVAALDP